MDERVAKYTAAQLKELGDKGHAFKNPDGSYSYPIDDVEDLKNAIKAVGMGNSDHDAIRKYIIGRAKAMGQSSLIPDNWNDDGSLKASAPGLDTRKARSALLKGREVRRMASSHMECRTIDGRIHLSGLASSTESPYDMNGWYTETVKRGAFAKTLSENPDVQLLINHEGLPLARTTNGSLALREDSNGLVFEAHAPEDDPDVATLARKIGAGLMDQCSFAFRVIRQKWSYVDDDAWDAGERDKRDIHEVSLDRGDVSVVNYGANPNTNVSIRSLFANLAEVDDSELEELRQDPAVLTIVRRLAIPEPIDPEKVGTAISGDAHHLSLFQARARALALRIS